MVGCTGSAQGGGAAADGMDTANDGAQGGWHLMQETCASVLSNFPAAKIVPMMVEGAQKATLTPFLYRCGVRANLVLLLQLNTLSGLMQSSSRSHTWTSSARSKMG